MNPTAWRVVAASVQGSGHVKRGQPCQDAHQWKILSRDVFVAALADGAGSAALAEVGATVAVDAALAFIARQRPPDWPDQEEPWRALMRDWLNAIRQAVLEEADHRKAPQRDLAATLVGVVSTPKWTAALQVGDGATVMAEQPDQLKALSRPCVSEYLNETVFLTSADVADRAQIAVHSGPITHLALLSDGLQMLALKMPQGEPHAPFFRPLFGLCDKDSTSAHEQLETFLRSPRIAARTDDDLTLILASRSP